MEGIGGVVVGAAVVLLLASLFKGRKPGATAEMAALDKVAEVGEAKPAVRRPVAKNTDETPARRQPRKTRAATESQSPET
ncbi:hypothetical protein [Parasulfuritortus cantonensis]|uniref:hypothetical protein n=1 Tax=Parasulfuritortus cantonensis TaxID=2528202 RepID=UPI00197FA722|nr:hypothetical protein [Parasulfuritortus cantonensis]